MDPRRLPSEHLPRPSGNDHLVESLIETTNFDTFMLTDMNDQSTEVPNRRSGFFKRFRRWTGRRLRAICPASLCRDRTSRYVEVLRSSEINPLNNYVIENTIDENVNKIVDGTVPSPTTNVPDTVMNSTPTNQQFANVSIVYDCKVDAISYVPSNLNGSEMNGNSECVKGIVDPMFKCWKHRYNFFSKFDAGIMLTRESFLSVCPEVISKHIAVSCSFNVAINPFCGVGEIAIQLAMVCKFVIAMDNDANKIKMAKLNATLYGVQDKIKFVVGDFFALGKTMNADIVVMSPPWGRGYWRKTVLPLVDLFQLHGGAENIIRIAKTIAPRVLLRLPTNVNVLECFQHGDGIEKISIEECSLDGIPNCLVVSFCSLTNWCDVSNEEFEKDEINTDKSLVCNPQFTSSYVQLHKECRQFHNGRKEKESYYKEYMDSVTSFLAVDDTNHSETQHN